MSAKCAHHWDIEPPTNPRSQGICRYCGAKKMFDNRQAVMKAEQWTLHPEKAAEALARMPA